MDYILTSNTKIYIAQILQNLYADINGEIANFLQFSYQEFCLLPFATPLKKVLSRIAQEDFLHAKSLANNIVLLGYQPLIQNNDGKYFSTRQLQPESSQKNMLNMDIEIKERSIINYKSAILKITDKKIKNELIKIVNEEKLHLQTLKNLQKQIIAREI